MASVTLRNPGERDRHTTLDLLVDTSALFSVVPAGTLEALGIPVDGRRRFKTADGRFIERPVGSVLYELGELLGAAPVVFGEAGDHPLLGVTAMEALGLEVDPSSGELKPMEHLLLTVG